MFFAETTTFSKIHMFPALTALSWTGEVRRASEGQVEKGGQNTPEEEGAEAKPLLVVVRDVGPLLWGTGRWGGKR